MSFGNSFSPFISFHFIPSIISFIHSFHSFISFIHSFISFIPLGGHRGKTSLGGHRGKMLGHFGKSQGNLKGNTLGGHRGKISLGGHRGKILGGHLGQSKGKSNGRPPGQSLAVDRPRAPLRSALLKARVRTPSGAEHLFGE